MSTPGKLEEVGQVRFSMKIKRSVFDEGTWGGREVTLEMLLKDGGQRSSLGKLILGGWRLLGEVSSHWLQGSPEGPQLHVARESLTAPS